MPSLRHPMTQDREFLTQICVRWQISGLNTALFRFTLVFNQNVLWRIPVRGGRFGMTPWCVLFCSWRRQLATYCPSLGPFPSIGGGAQRPFSALCPSPLSSAYLSLSTSLSFPSEGCANGPPGPSLFTALCWVHTEEGNRPCGWPGASKWAPARGGGGKGELSESAGGPSGRLLPFHTPVGEWSGEVGRAPFWVSGSHAPSPTGRSVRSRRPRRRATVLVGLEQVLPSPPTATHRQYHSPGRPAQTRAGAARRSTRRSTHARPGIRNPFRH